MARIKEVKEIALEDLEIGQGQARVHEVSDDITELADSIRKLGLLEPIVVCEGRQRGKYEILTGQRRFLAHQELGLEKIMCAVLDEKVDPKMAKVISVSENLVRRDLNRRDLIDACTWLYHQYGSIRDVVEATGLSNTKVSEYVKYDRLIPELRKLVDEDGVDIKLALRAQDAASVSGAPKPKEAVALARAMSGMSGVQQRKLVEERKENPKKPVDELLERAKSGGKVTQIVVTLGENIHRALSAYAKQEGTNMDDAASQIIQNALSDMGFKEE